MIRLVQHLLLLPETIVGLLLAALCVPGEVRFRAGAIEFLECRWLPLGRQFHGRTIGATITIVRGKASDRLLTHEREHVAQGLRWGLLHVPAYVVASLVAVLRGGDWYRDNHFEREARRAAGQTV